MSRARRMLEAQKKRERDELPLDTLEGRLHPSLSSSPIKRRTTEDIGASDRQEEDVVARVEVRVDKTPTLSPRQRTSRVPAYQPAGIDAVRRDQSAQNRTPSPGSSRSSSPPPLCSTSSGRPKRAKTGTTADYSAETRPSMGAMKRTRSVTSPPSTRYPAHRLLVVSQEQNASVSTNRIEPDTDSLSRSTSRATPPPPPALAPPRGRPPLATSHALLDLSCEVSQRTIPDDPMCTSAGPSPSSPSVSAAAAGVVGGLTQRPAFRAVVSPGTLPQHLSRAGSRHSTPMLSQQSYQTQQQAQHTSFHASGHEETEEEPWLPLPPSSVQPVLCAVKPSVSATPPTILSDLGDGAASAEALTSTSTAVKNTESAFPAFPSVPLSPLVKQTDTCTAHADVSRASCTPPPPPSPETTRLQEEWEPQATARSPSQETEPHLDDYSGFRNRGNDCYACSVLTLLLRNELFRQWLLYSPMMVAWRLYHGEPLSVKSVESGYRPAPQAPTRKASRNATGIGKNNLLARAQEETTLMDAFEARHGYRLTEDDADMLVDEEPEDEAGRSPNALAKAEDDVVESSALHTVHTILAHLVKKQQTRETVVCRVNDPCCRLALRRAYFLKCVGDDPDGPRARAYFHGVSMASLAGFFEDEFFMGFQEDAHEFLVALLNKLEEEAVAFEKKRRMLVKVRAETGVVAAAPGHANVPEAGEREKEKAESRACSTSASSRDSASDVGQVHATPPPHATPETATATLARTVWVNRLLQGRLLSIIRCRHAGCGHEIVTEEPFMNLTLPVTLPVAAPTATTTTTPATSGITPVDVEAEANDAVGAPPSCEVPSVATLLQHTMQYDKLEGYACDGCQSSGEQWQGGCFLGSPPPLLLMQLKRFDVSFEKGEVVISKKDIPVKVDAHLVVHSLLDAQHTSEDTGETGAAEGADVLYRAAGKCFSDALHNLEQCCASESLRRDEEDEAREGETVKPAPSTCPLVHAIRAEYRLQGLVLHLGHTLHFGHYVAEFAAKEWTPKSDKSNETDADCHGSHADARDDDEVGSAVAAETDTSQPDTRFVWRLANDSRVSALSETSFQSALEQNRMCYLLLYEKISEEVMKCPLWSVIPRDQAA